MAAPLLRSATTVRDELREDLLGAPATRTCDRCATVVHVERWLVEVTVDGDRVGYCGRCPACGGRDTDVIVDPAGRW